MPTACLESSYTSVFNFSRGFFTILSEVIPRYDQWTTTASLKLGQSIIIWKIC